MATIDKAALIEAAAKAIHSRRVYMARGVTEQPPPPTQREVDDAAAALPVIARELLAPLRELHARNGNPRYGCCATPKVCTDPHQAVCGAPEHGTNKPHWPCPTVRLLDQIESDAKGDER